MFVHEKRIWSASLPQFANSVLSTALFAIGLLSYESLVVAAFLSFASYFIFMIVLSPTLLVLRTEFRLVPRFRGVGAWTRVALTPGLSSVLATIAVVLPRFALADKGEADVGIFTAAVAVATLPNVVFGALSVYYLSQFRRSVSASSARLLRSTRRALGLHLAIACVYGCAFIGIGQSVIKWVFGKDFYVPQSGIVVLAVGGVFLGLVWLVDALLLVLGPQRVLLLGSTIGVVVAVVMSMIVVPQLGLVGAMVAYSSVAVATAVFKTTAFLFSRRGMLRRSI